MSILKETKSIEPRPGSAVITAGRDGSVSLDEPLAISAPLALEAAKRYCRHYPVQGQSCLSYHGTWQYRRLFGLVTSITDLQRGFFLDALGSLAVDGRYPRVLITGTTDYAMMAIVLKAYRDSKAEVNLTVLDRCETPLVLNRWYAEQVSHPVDVRTCDVLDYHSPRPFDVICTHSLVNHFPPASRPGLVAKWRQLLRPGGKLVTANKIRPGADEGPVTAKTERVELFREEMRRAAKSWPDLVGVTPEELADHAAVLMRRQLYHMSSLKRLRSLLTDGGLAVERLETSSVEERAQVSASDYAIPAKPGKGKFYAHVVCARRQ